MYPIRVYKICNNFDNACYIGSTKQTLSQRLCDHKKPCKQTLNTYKYVNNTGRWNNWRIILLKEYNVNSRQEQFQKEQKWIDKYKNNNKFVLLNMQNAYNSLEEKKQCIKRHNQSEKSKLCRRNYDNSEKGKISHQESSKKRLKIPYYCKCGAISSISTKSQHKKSKTYQLCKNNPLLRINTNIFM